MSFDSDKFELCNNITRKRCKGEWGRGESKGVEAERGVYDSRKFLK